MFLYDNNIVSESYLTVDSEPVIDFYTEAMGYNKTLLAESMDATQHMLDTVYEYGATSNVLTEAFSDWKDKIVKFLKEFKARIITLFRRWIDWISKKLHAKGRYGDDAVEKLLNDSTKCSALSSFKMDLTEPTDFGYTYFNELKNPAYPNNLKASATAIQHSRINSKGKDDNNDYDIKKIRDTLTAETQSYLNGSKITQVDINTIRTLYDNKKGGDKTLKKYKDVTVAVIDQITKIADTVGGLGNDMVKDQQAYNALITISTCLNEHLTKMANEYPTYINRIDQTINSFLPQAEQYLLAK